MPVHVWIEIIVIISFFIMLNIRFFQMLILRRKTNKKLYNNPGAFWIIPAFAAGWCITIITLFYYYILGKN